MILEKRKISQLKPNPKNPRVCKQSTIDAVAHSIKEFGYVVPIVVDEENNVLAGHTRIKALEQQQVEEVEVVVLKGLTEKQKRAFTLADNKLAELNDWDDKKLSEMVKGIEEELRKYGFESEVLDALITGEEKEDKKPEVKKTTTIQVGDMYQLGSHKIICGDSTDPEVYKRLMGDERAKVCFTSPPYNMAAEMYEEYEDDKGSEEYVKFNGDVLECVKNYLDGFLFWNISYNKNTRHEFIDVLYYIKNMKGMRFLELIVWNKRHAIPITADGMLTRVYEDIFVAGTDSVAQDIEMFTCSVTGRQYCFNKKTRKGISNFWEIDTKGSQVEGHQACYPVALPERGISLMSDIGDIVLEPFGGSGTTLIACEKLHRKCRLIELAPIYMDMIIRRWEEYTGQKAIKC